MWCDINRKREVAVIGRASMHASDRKRSTGAWMERLFIQWSKCLHGRRWQIDRAGAADSYSHSLKFGFWCLTG